MNDSAKLTVFGKQFYTSRRIGLAIILSLLAVSVPSLLFATYLVLAEIASLTGLHEIMVAVLALIFLAEVTSSTTGLMGNEFTQKHAILPKIVRQLIGFSMLAYTAWSLYSQQRFGEFCFLVIISLMGYLSTNPLLHISGNTD
jgi:hypothetical protein